MTHSRFIYLSPRGARGFWRSNLRWRSPSCAPRKSFCVFGAQKCASSLSRGAKRSMDYFFVVGEKMPALFLTCFKNPPGKRTLFLSNTKNCTKKARFISQNIKKNTPRKRLVSHGDLFMSEVPLLGCVPPHEQGNPLQGSLESKDTHARKKVLIDLP